MSLRPTQLVLAGVVLLALGLMAVPLLLVVRVPPDAMHGVVVDERGFGIPDAAVYLFSERTLRLVEETRTDAHGAFALALDTSEPRLLVRAPVERDLLPSWSPSASGSALPLAFVLHPSHPLEVRVTDPAGVPIVGAEVRAYECGDEPVVVSLVRTDARGLARLAAPERTHVRVDGPAPARLARWRLDLRVPAEGLQLAVRMPAARLVSGTVRAGGELRSGVVLIARQGGPDTGWNGFARSDSEGRFALPFTEGPGEILALDPDAHFLTERLVLPTAAPEGELEISLQEATPLVVRAAHDGTALAARTWSWSPAGQTWSWGVLSGGDGGATVPVRGPYGIHSRPLDPAWIVPDAWDQMDVEGPLTLPARRAR